jgi:pantoate--beta-alanine ligase
MQAARAECDVVVVSLFVNPSQFNDPRDLEAYPRDEAHDAALAQAQGVDVLFVPPVDEVYPSGFSTTVVVQGVTERLEGAHRGREHFDGVATVVTKLLNMVGPDVAYFGQKDAQQALVIKQFVRDLNIPVRVAVCPTVRESDGLAMSSRNVHLHGLDRQRAAALHRALQCAGDAVAAGELDAAAVSERARLELTDAGVELEYLELVDPETLEPVSRIHGAVLALVAARVGSTRLIDNQMLAAPVAAGLIPDGRT